VFIGDYRVLFIGGLECLEVVMEYLSVFIGGLELGFVEGHYECEQPTVVL